MIDKDATRPVHTDGMKLRMLNTKVRADFLNSMKTNIQMEMNKVPRTITFQNALANYRNVVNEKFPQDQSAHTKKRRIQSTRSSHGGRGSGVRSHNGRGHNSGRGSQFGRDNNNNRYGSDNGGGNRTSARREDEWKVVGKNGKPVAVHPAYQFNRDDWFNLPEQVRHQLTAMRKEHKAKRARTMSQVGMQPFDTQYGAPNTVTVHSPPPPPATHVSVPNYGDDRNLGQVSIHYPNQNHHTQGSNSQPSLISAVTMSTQADYQSQGGLMGGRNEQSQKGGPGMGYRRVSNVVSKRRKIMGVEKLPEPKPNTVANNEADTNADTCCLGTNFVPIAYTNRSADVYPYNEAYEPLENITHCIRSHSVRSSKRHYVHTGYKRSSLLWEEDEAQPH